MKFDARLRWKTRLFAAIVILSNIFGNFWLKWGMDHRDSRLEASVASYIQAIFNPWVALGISLLIVWLLARMALLSWADLSYVLPVTSLGYVGNALMGRFFLHEQITTERWMGTLLIMAGVGLVGLSQPASAHKPEAAAELAGAGTGGKA
jgi:drug/metabolite transporter (DMT)-like permease